MDFGGGWRQLHYRARHFFQPVTVTLHLEDRVSRTVHVSLINDLAVRVLGEC
jgi:beta-mannosidase